MAWTDTLMNGFFSLMGTLWHLFLAWLWVFIVPFTNFNVLWIIIPIWLAWFFAEYFQEKKSTSFGNSISNGVIPIWVGIDWTRFLVGEIGDGALVFGLDLVIKLLIIIAVFAYGIFITYCGIKGRRYVRFLGRIREVTYILLFATPVIYGILDLGWQHVTSFVLFFPLWYFGLELLFRLLPTPRAMRKDDASTSSF